MTVKKANNFQRIRELSIQKQFILGATLVQRMLPNYQLFSETTGFGDTHVLQSALAVMWERIVSRKVVIDFEKQIEKVEPCVPELNDFDMVGVYPAIDTATALISLIQGVEEEDGKYLVDVSKISQASVSKMIEFELACEMDTTSDEIMIENQQIREHPLMQYEMSFLGELLDKIESLGKVDSATVREMRKYAHHDGMTNIALSLEDDE